MKSGKNKSVLRENDEYGRACSHGDKEGDMAIELHWKGSPPLTPQATPVLYKMVDR